MTNGQIYRDWIQTSEKPQKSSFDASVGTNLPEDHPEEAGSYHQFIIYRLP